MERDIYENLRKELKVLRSQRVYWVELYYYRHFEKLSDIANSIEAKKTEN